MASDATIRKADRMFRSGRVHRIPDAEVFTVESTSGNTYVVVVDPHDRSRAVCTCPATGRCSHMIAAGFQLNSDRTGALA